MIRKHIDDFTVIGTDHCPFDLNLKKASYTSQIPMGIGGIRYSFVNMFTEFGPSIIAKFTDGPAKAYGMYPGKGTLIPGADGDLVIFDDNQEEVINDTDSVYHGKKLKGKVLDVFLRGQQIVQNGTFSGSQGKYISRKLNG
ncbi:MAG: amidohydrolase family protein [Anaerocolumna sp.]